MSLSAYKKRFDQHLSGAIEALGEKGNLRDACEYALMSGGKRLRPVLVLMTADALKLGLDVMPAACGVEFFHTASLIADDLPCMDNDAVRRGRPSVHKKFGETTAILASYTLIAAGYGGIHQNGEAMKSVLKWAAAADGRVNLCLESATQCAGLHGATQGQYTDLFPPGANLATIRKTIYQKTVTLFEVAFLFGWLFGGGNEAKMPSIKKAAYHLGMAFQIADDLDDHVQDAAHPNLLNIVAFLGKEKAISLLEEEIAALRRSLRELDIWTDAFQELVERLSARNNLFSRAQLFQSAAH